MNLCCPHGQPFHDFKGCAAVTCECPNPTSFCAFCLEDCGRDAHNHNGRCVENFGRDKLYPTEMKSKRLARDFSAKGSKNTWKNIHHKIRVSVETLLYEKHYKLFTTK